MKFQFIVVLLALTLAGFTQNNISVHGEHFTNNKSLSSTGIVLNIELQILGSKSPWHLFYEHGLEANTDQLAHIRTSLPLYGLLRLLAFDKNNTHSNDNGKAYSLVFFIPNGISYHIPQNKINYFSIKCNPLGFSYWQLKNEKKVSAMDFQIGMEYFLSLKKRQGLVFGVNCSFQYSIGKKEVKPIDYKNEFFTSFRIGYKWGFDNSK